MHIGFEELWKVKDNKIFRVEFLYEIIKYTQYQPLYFQMLNSLRMPLQTLTDGNF